MTTREIISWAVCGTIVIVLAGLVLFGGGDSSGGQADGADAAEGEIRQMLSRTFTQNDPAQCTEDATPNFLRQSFGRDGDDPLEECRRENTEDEDTSAESVQIDSVTVEGATAKAVFTASGGSMDGSVVTVELVHDFDRWKLDRMTDIQIDRARFDAALREDASDDGEITAGEADCYVAAISRSYDTPALERLTLQGQEGFAALRQIAVSCLSRATVVGQFTKGLERSMAEDGIPTQAAECISAAVVRSLGVKGIRQMTVAGPSAAAQYEPVIRAAVLRCGEAYQSGLLGGAGRS